MSIRFRRSVRLFPGVRLNFSGSGVSTTVGVRGASINLGPRGSHVNVGIPGSGISARTRISPSSKPRRSPALSGPPQGSASAPVPAPVLHVPPPAFDAASLDYESADVSALTSPGLGELKRLINEAAVRHAALKIEVAGKRRRFRSAYFWLRFSRAFIVRIFTGKLVSGLEGKAQARLDELDDAEAQLEGCHVEVDFGLDVEALDSYAALLRTFDSLRCCQAIWDVTSTHAVDRVAERTAASHAVTRKRVGFDFVTPEIVRSQHRAMQLGNVTGKDIQLFPGFLMMKDRGADFALIEYGDASLRFDESHFIEQSNVPSDSQVVGHTWLKANKDGSRDRRFKDNRQIPVALYGELLFQSREGLLEAYLLSDARGAEAFARAYRKHSTALTELARRGNEGAPSSGVGPETDEAADTAEQSESRFLINAPRPKSLVADWIGLCVLVATVGAGAFWLDTHGASLIALLTRQPPPPASSVVSSVQALPKHHRGHRKRHIRDAVRSAAATAL